MFNKYDGVLAKFYDIDHAWRDYALQTRLISQLFSNQRERKNIQVLDIACGSGSHSVLMAKKGFQVTGIDLSKTLLEMARKKAKEEKVSARFLRRNILNLGASKYLHSKFDCVVFLGWSLNLEFFFNAFHPILKVVSALLKDGGLFVLDAAMGTQTHPVSREPILYSITDDLKAKLKISERADKKNQIRKLRYNWTVSKKKSVFHYSAKENLVVLKPSRILDVVRNKKHGLRIQKILSAYRLNSTFRKNSANMLLILKKGI